MAGEKIKLTKKIITNKLSNKLYAKECNFSYEITDILESDILNMKILETSSK